MRAVRAALTLLLVVVAFRVVIMSAAKKHTPFAMASIFATFAVEPRIRWLRRASPRNAPDEAFAAPQCQYRPMEAWDHLGFDKVNEWDLVKEDPLLLRDIVAGGCSRREVSSRECIVLLGTPAQRSIVKRRMRVCGYLSSPPSL
ncbi:hypothetical protein FA13DRAFT_239083 [Coprinellus micaceus]|uniref:Uncharacterized protein n=1 Tax=Coprinellus micaceus TaxID=71717 RepID=A0A4Y7SF04_COPMI|nr:hypothetical protein FA13DRAFT_239083 [Coprinellus micaceus]